MLHLHKFILLLFLLSALTLQGQIRPGMNPPGNGNAELPEGEETKEKVVAPRVRAWTLSDFGAFTDSVAVDTLLENYHNYNPVYKNSITNSYTGNYGGAYLANDFSKRVYNSEFFFFRSHDAWLLTPRQLIFYNTTTPYTLLDYSQSESKSRGNETRLNVLHSQNVSPGLNVTLRYDQAKSDGQYNFQKNKNHFISLYSSYSGPKLNAAAGFIFNRVFNGENGGMSNDAELLTTETEYVQTRLTDALSEHKNSYVFANAEYRIGVTEQDTSELRNFRPVAGFLYSFLLSNNLRMFREGESEDNSSFWPVAYINPDFSRDSVRMSSVTNLFQLKFYESETRKYSFGKRAFAGMENTATSFAAPGYREAIFPFHPGKFNGTIYAGPEQRWYHNNYANTFVGGGIFRETGKFWTWNFDGRQYLTGYKAGQTELNGEISKPVGFLNDSLSSIIINGNLLNNVPDIFQQRYFSNRVKWDNNFSNEQQMNAAFSFSSPRHHLEAGARYSLYNNFIYNDTAGIPSQTKSELLLLSAWLNKTFQWGNFSLMTQFLWQKASAPQYIHLPDLSARMVVSYRMVLAKVLYVQFGADTRYNTSYYADAYQPATGLFYLQDEKKLGNYPYIDAFANLKLKRTRVFFQYMNLGGHFLNEPYFTALHYPMNGPTFRLGVSWSFYN